MEKARSVGSHGILESFRFAFQGIFYVLSTQKHMRFHFIAAALVLFVSFLLQLHVWETLILFFTIALVLIAEMFNTCLEITIDMITAQPHPHAKIVKDVAAGIVLVAALNSLVVAALILLPKLIDLFVL